MHAFISRRGAAIVAAAVAGIVAYGPSLSAQARPTPEAHSFTPAQVRAATSALDTHLADHPKGKAPIASAKTTSSAATNAQRTRALRTPVPALRASTKVKKTP